MSESSPTLRLVEPLPSRQEGEPVTSETPLNLDELIDSDVLTALRTGIETASPELRLTLLTIIEHPELHRSIERTIASTSEALR